MIFLVMITLTFWTGVAVGGVKCVDLHKPAQQSAGGDTRSWWFFAQILNGGYAVTSYAVGKWSTEAGYLAWPSGDVASVYTGVAGLLNLLIIIDALSRAEGLPSAPRSRRRPVSSAGPPGTGGTPGG